MTVNERKLIKSPMCGGESKADLRENSLLTFDLPIQRDKCARFAVCAVKADGSFIPIAVKAE